MELNGQRRVGMDGWMGIPIGCCEAWRGVWDFVRIISVSGFGNTGLFVSLFNHEWIKGPGGFGMKSRSGEFSVGYLGGNPAYQQR